MDKVLYYISEDIADFETTLAFHKIKNVEKSEILSNGYNYDDVVSESGLYYKPNLIVREAMELKDIEGLILPGGPIKSQQEALTELTIKLDKRGENASCRVQVSVQ